MDFKVRYTKSSTPLFEKGKVYMVKDGKLQTEKGYLTIFDIEDDCYILRAKGKTLYDTKIILKSCFNREDFLPCENNSSSGNVPTLTVDFPLPFNTKPTKVELINNNQVKITLERIEEKWTEWKIISNHNYQNEYEYRRKGKTVQVRNSLNKQCVGEAICCDEDEFDLNKGIEIAYHRCLLKNLIK